MMPRRRRKENDKRRSLMFAESPVESAHDALTPVRADHPIAVNCVSVFDDTCVTWVSPQFQGLVYSHGKRRQARRRHLGGISTRLRSLNKENTFADSVQRGTRRQFPTLKFMKDESEAASPSYVVSLMEHSLNTVARRESYRRDNSLVHTATGIVNSTGGCMHKGGKQMLQGKSHNRKSVAVADHEQREESRACDNNSVDENWLETSTFGSLEDSSMCDVSLGKNGRFLDGQSCATNSKRRRKKNRSKQLPQTEQDKPHGLPQQDVRRSPQCKDFNTVSEGGKGTRKSNASDILLSPLESENGSLLAEKGKRFSTVVHKNLTMLHYNSPSEVADCYPTATNVSDDQLFHAVDNPLVHTAIVAVNSTSGCMYKGVNCLHLGCDGHPVTSTDHTKSGIPTDDTQGQTLSGHRKLCLSVDSPSGVRRSRRLKEKYLEALKYLRPSTPSNTVTEHNSRTRSQNCGVLVADTPEREYGLSFRKRQLRLRHK